MFQKQATSQVTWTIEKINENTITNTQLQLGLHELGDLMNRISIQQNLFRLYAEHQDDLEHSTLEKFALGTVSSDSNSIQTLLDRIHLLIIGSQDLASVGNTGLLYSITNNLQVI